MHKIQEVVRLKFDAGLSNRQIAASCALARSTVAEYLGRLAAAGLSWPLPEGLSEAQLQRRLFPEPAAVTGLERPLPIWAAVHAELRGKGVTLMRLWQEYKEQYPETGYQYSQFAELYRVWLGRVDVVMRQHHRAGEKLFVDYAGQTVEVVSRDTGEVRTAQIFVAVLGASRYTFCEATWSQGSEDWIGSHMRAFAYFGGVSEVVVPDNLKSAVDRPHRYDPDINRAYAEMLRHYGAAVVPARVARPRDKAPAEAGVLLVERWVLACLRRRTFFSLEELNQAIGELLERLNERPFQKLPGSRRSQFETLERPALRPLPSEPYALAAWFKARVALNLHIRIEQAYYSVPYALVKHEVEARLSARTLEVFFQGERVAVHPRSWRPGSYTTQPGHLPEGHQRHLEWTPERLLRWAADNGPHTAALIAQVIDSRPFPQQAFNACLGIMRLGSAHDGQRLEAACRRALHFGTHSYKSIAAILKHGLDRQPLPGDDPAPAPIHDNLRGPSYYH
jgi:transposase